MSLIEPTIIEQLRKHRRAILYGVAGFLLFMFVLWLFAYQDACSYRRSVSQKQADLESKRAELQKLANDAAELQLQKKIKEAEIAQKRIELANAEKDVENAKTETNNSANRADDIRNGNFDGSNINAARCAAYPESCR
jgi:type II secretory pathway component PulM